MHLIVIRGCLRFTVKSVLIVILTMHGSHTSAGKCRDMLASWVGQIGFQAGEGIRRWKPVALSMI